MWTALSPACLSVTDLALNLDPLDCPEDFGDTGAGESRDHNQTNNRSKEAPPKRGV